ncbi:MAG: hypothetical protein ABEK59_00710 [Halobacteria archaeon]
MSTAVGAVVHLGLVASAVLLAISLLAYLRRRSVSYLLLFLAFCTVFIRLVLAAVSVNGLISRDLHHLFEHVLDLVLVALVLAAVYHARSVERSAERGSTVGDNGVKEGLDD